MILFLPTKFDSVLQPYTTTENSIFVFMAGTLLSTLLAASFIYQVSKICSLAVSRSLVLWSFHPEELKELKMSGGRFHDGEGDGYDAVVVGSGYGGSVSACRMSMAGLKVCLTEKGRKWEAQDFPTDSFKMLSAFRMENQNLGVCFGSKDALYQVYINNDSVAAVACGLGGGSLVNAGVMLPTPARVRKNPKWPKEWETDWDICEANAADMLRVQSVPTRFPMSRAMEKITGGDIEESYKSSMKLSVNFEGSALSSSEPPKMDSCIACGNCLTGCPYNAKNSTDKNYLMSAIQAGCLIKTGGEVQYIVENPYEGLVGCTDTRRIRRWRVYFNEIDYITSDHVVISAGVFGTTEILFRSQMRGLQLSEMLGCGFSCNGNNVAYFAGSPAPLGAYGLNKKDISKVPYQDRPGPSISSVYTSSLGFTIQSAVLPSAYPYMIFKGITTYRWPTGFCFFHGIIDKLKHILGLRFSQAMVFNVMGHDESDGKITFKEGKIRFGPPSDPLLPRKVEALQKLSKKLGGILFMSRYRSTSVHLLGGCNAASDVSGGVCNANGQVFDPRTPGAVYQGLYVCDASLIPCSIGINPSLTIAAAAEHVGKRLVRDALRYRSEKCVESVHQNTADENIRPRVVFKETMRGHLSGMPCTAYLKLKMNNPNNGGSDEMDENLSDLHQLLRGKVGGYVECQAIEKDKLHVIDGEVNLCGLDSRTPYTQYMQYRLLLATSSGSRYVLEGRKIMNPYFFALHGWKETTTLHVTFTRISKDNSMEEILAMKGQLRVSLIELLKTLISFEGNGRARFLRLFFQTLLKTYILQTPRSHKHLTPSNSYTKPYPNSDLHELKTGDGFVVSCRQWKCIPNPARVMQEKLYPVLLLNGHSVESYWLPTEPNDLVRTLLDKGHETWLLQPRLHPLNPSNSFTLDDIARFDIPAVMNKILKLHGTSTKVHVVAHCVGGLSIHIALMGGHVSASRIASLSCTNSSMFFKLRTYSTVKMRLPLLPISMTILGKNTILPLTGKTNLSSRHRILKSIALFLPRYERCDCEECEVFSGIFGNAFWHQNITPTLHNWLNKENTTKLPMSAFPHIRKICNSGFIVDRDGNNSYMIHPERMAVPTLYVSGGRSLLVTPETSFLANKYMRLHQPGFRHERVVVDGFGHSDLLIGEESDKKVFPNILDHMGLAEKEGNGVERKYSKEALDWEADPYEAAYRDSWSWVFSFVTLGMLLLVFAVFFSFFSE